MLRKGDKAAIVCCSNGLKPVYREQMERLCRILERAGVQPVLSRHIYAEQSVFCGTGRERAESLMTFYQDPSIKTIFDVSGGDLANEILPYLDFDVIAESKKQFWGYSDLTTIINAIYTKTGNASVLYQIRNLLYEHGERQFRDFTASVLDEKSDLFDIRYRFVQKKRMQGIVVGGNIRCLLKLAGTPYWPDMNGKILLLEAYSGDEAKMVTYLNQLKQIGVFDQVNGILLGTFTQMEQEEKTIIIEDLASEGREKSVGQTREERICELVKRYAGDEVPIAKTGDIGHGTDSKAIVIGKEEEITCWN